MIVFHIESDETSSGEILHNLCGKNVQTGAMMWHPDCVHLSYMPYLLIIAKRICTATGYSFDFSQWEMSPKRHLLVCNVMPESLVMHNFSYPLPHWTVSEFFENIEFLLGGRFSIDSEAMHIAFNTDAKLIEDAGTVYLSQVVDEFDATVELNPEKEQRPEFMRNRGYESNSGRFWDVRCCDWYIRRRITGAPDPDTASGTAPSGPVRNPGRTTNRLRPGWAYETMLDTTQEYKNIKRFATLTQLIEDAEAFMFSKNYPGFEGDPLFYAEDVSCFFCLRAVAIVDYGEIPEEFRKKYLPTGVAGYYHNILFPVNDFGDYTLEDRDDADRIELKAVPVDIDATDHGPCCFLPFSDASDSEGDSTLVDEIRQPKSLSLILGGKKERAQFYDKLYVGFWTGLPENYQKTGRYPYTSNVSLYDGWHYRLSPEGCSLRLNHGFRYGSEDFMNVDFNKIYKISFISDTIPNIAAVFNIRGKRYLCRKLSADFSDSGLSRIIKGEFYRISQPTDTPQSS